ncbi:hypothetical protein JHK82_053546 [Glycine max]|nr:hypothetical protein JHK86_053399 [Glycine max]KAG5083379.1 hypothetical protein JHK84_053417 [Glycine max]KAG5086149.1 hypothetical protein JHK82_053546 [Glycine max]
MTKNEIDKVVTKILAEMGLQDSTDSRLGNWHLRGISSGLKRRLSIGIEIITQPHVMFLDEPTTKGEVFNLFDDLVLLSGGEAVYFGEATMTVKFFADAGFPCPTRKSPPEHFLGCISSEFNGVAALIQSKNEEPLVGKIYDTSRLKQLCTLTNRSILNMTRDIGYYCLRIVFYILISVRAGFHLFNIGTSTEAILTRGKCDGFLVGLMIYICLGGVPFYHEELKVFMMVPSNIFRSLADLPKFFWRYPMSYISYITWSIQGQFKNDLIGLEFEPEVPGDTKIKGEEILNNMFGIRNGGT